MRRFVLVALAVVSVFAAACDKSSPAEPTKTVSSLSMSPGTDWIRIKGTEKFNVSAQYSTGAAEAVTPAWTSDSTGVATVDASGTVTGIAAGQATITASYQGKSITRALRVIPDYAGRWAGSWAVTSCAVQGDFVANWCEPVRNGVFPATLDILQTKDVVSATWTLQEATGSAQGSIAADGKLSLTGSTPLQAGVRIEITLWQTVTFDNRTMTGSFTLKWTTSGKSGSAQTTANLQNFTKQ
jgi:hypothetical protein